jgi:predicted Zn-dependent protease
LTASAAAVALLALAVAPCPVAAQAKPESTAAGYCNLVMDQAVRATCLAGRDQYNKGQYRAALVTIRKAFAAAPKEGALRAMTAYIMLTMGDAGSAERELREARKGGAPDHVVLPALLRLMISRHEESELLTEFPEPPAGAKGEAAADILYGRAHALVALQRLPEAAAATDRSLALRRDGPALVLRADIASKQNDRGLAAKLVEEALQREPESGPAALAKLNLIRSSGDPAKTLAFSQDMLGRFPDAIEFRRARIETFLETGQDDKAKAEINALMAKLPNSNFGRYYTALLMVRANDKKGAWQIMQLVPPQFVRLNPSCAMPMAQLAVENAHTDLGMSILANAISADPGLVDARLQLANLRLAANTPQAALSILAPVKDSSDPRVQKLLSNIQARIAKDRAF